MSDPPRSPPAEATMVTTSSAPTVGSEPAPAAAPAPVATMPSSAAATQPETAPPEDPRLAPLVAMFPDFDQQLLLSVLDSCGGDHDLAVDMLLEMANPDYKSTNQGGRKSQSDLDEELARRLAAEEEYNAAAAWQPNEREQQHSRRPDGGSRSGSDSSRRSNRLPEADTFAQVQESAMKIAETGKKAFLSFAATVKKKIQEFDAGPAEDPTYPTNEPGPQTSSYYRPPQPVTQQQQFQPPPSVHGYNIAPALSQPINHTQSISIPSSTAPSAAQRSGPGSVSTSPNTGGLSSSPAPPANIDTARLGLLPKRPVSLVDTSTGSGSKKATVTDEDDDDLEYVENPFDDRRR